jgi:hypothetical protein
MSLFIAVASFIRKHKIVYAKGKKTGKGPDRIEEATVSNKFQFS